MESVYLYMYPPFEAACPWCPHCVKKSYLTSVVLVLLYLHTGIYTRTYMASDGRGPTDLASETECVSRTGTSQYGTPGTM